MSEKQKPSELPPFIFPPQTEEEKCRSALAEATKPQQTSPSNSVYTVSAYYNLKTAMTIKEVADHMIADSQDRRFPLAKFKLKPNSLYLFVVHGFKYLVDHLDKGVAFPYPYEHIATVPKGQYLKLRSLTTIGKEPEGVCIRFVTTGLDMQNIVDRIAPKSELHVQKWKKDLRAFIESNPDNGSMHEVHGFTMDNDDITYVESLLIPLADMYVYKIADAKNFMVVMRQDNVQPEEGATN